MGQDDTGGIAMVMVPEAVEAFVRREVAAMRASGCRVWVRRCPWQDWRQEDRTSFAYWMAVDDQPELWFEPVYRGQLDDLVPAGFDDFTLFIGGGKVIDFPSDVLAGAAGDPTAAPVVTAPDGTPLRFVTRIDSVQAAEEWLSRPDAYLRCGECGFVPDHGMVRVGDPEQECDCGAFARDENGRLEWDEEYRFMFPAVYLASSLQSGSSV